MAYQTIGQAFSNPYRTVTSEQTQRARANYLNERAGQAPQLLKMRQQAMQLREQMTNARIQQMQQMMHMKQQQLDLADRREDRMEKGSGLTAVQDARLKYQMGVPFERQTADGGVGTYVMPTQAERSKLENVVDAMPQLAEVMQQVQKGAKYYVSNGGHLDQLFSAVTAAMTGSATPKQEKILSEARISNDSLTQAAETAARVMNIPRTNEGLRSLFGLFAPKKGDTLNSFYNSQKVAFNNLKDRATQAQYQLNGIPQDLNSARDMQRYIHTQRLKNYYDTSFENGDSSNLNNKSSDLPDGVTEQDVKNAMARYPDMSRDQVIKALASIVQKQGQGA